MGKREFLKELRDTLTEVLPPTEADSHIRYYEQYIMERMGQGMNENEIISALGSPRLLAKTIIDTSGSQSSYNEGGQYCSYDNDYTKSESGTSKSRELKQIKRKNTIRLLMVIFLVLFVISAVVRFIGMILPVVLPVIVILLLLLYFKKK